MQSPAVERAPITVQALNAVGDHDVGMELGIAAAGVPVVEGRGDQTSYVELDNAVVTGSGERRVLLDQLEDIVDCVVVGGDDLLLSTDIGGRPERRNRLDGGEGEVESGDRLLRLLAHLALANLLDLDLPLGLAQAWVERADLVLNPF